MSLKGGEAAFVEKQSKGKHQTSTAAAAAGACASVRAFDSALKSRGNWQLSRQCLNFMTQKNNSDSELAHARIMSNKFIVDQHIIGDVGGVAAVVGAENMKAPAVVRGEETSTSHPFHPGFARSR